MKRKTPKIIYVEWYDATLVSALKWERASALQSEGCHVTTAGFLVKEDETGIFVAGDCDPSNPDRVRCVTFIPKAMIRRRRTFTP